MHPMTTTIESKQKLREICRVAARVFYEKGYDGASMQDIAKAVGLTKAGLYHHVGSKDRLLYEIMNYGMDILDETVLQKVKDIQDPREKLRQTMIGHIDLIVRARDLEITVILH
jgi:AcrR family transcriptional regulator